MRFNWQTWHDRAKKLRERIATQLKPHSRFRKRLKVSQKLFRQWLSRRGLIHSKLKETIMKLPITGGVMIVAIELIITFGGAAVISFYETSPGESLTIFNEDPWLFNWAQLWLIMGMIITGLSFRFDRTVKANKLAVRTIFDRPTDVLSSGLPILPPAISDYILLPTDVVQNEHPGEPEDIFRQEDVEVVPEGKVPPFRVTFSEPITEQRAKDLFGEEYTVIDRHGHSITFQHEAPDDALAKRVTGEVVTVSRYRIEEAIPFVKYIGNPDNASKQLEDELFGVIERVYTRISLGQAKQNVGWMNALLFHAACARVKPTDGRKAWGVEIEDAYVKALPLSHGLNSAIQDIAETVTVATNRERLAETDRIEREKKGQGDAAAEKALLTARAEGLEEMKKLAGSKGGRIAISTEAARELAASGNTIITDAQGGMGQLMSLVGAGSAVVKRDKTSGDTQSAKDTSTSNEGESS